MATFERHVDVEWTGSVMEGGGTAKAGTGAFTLPVTFPVAHRRAGRQDQPGGADGRGARGVLRDGAQRHASAGPRASRSDRTVVRATITADKGDAGIKIQSSKLEVTALRPQGRRRREVQRDRDARREPLPGVERLPRHDADHGRDQGRLRRNRERGCAD